MPQLMELIVGLIAFGALAIFFTLGFCGPTYCTKCGTKMKKRHNGRYLQDTGDPDWKYYCENEGEHKR